MGKSVVIMLLLAAEAASLALAAPAAAVQAKYETEVHYEVEPPPKPKVETPKVEENRAVGSTAQIACAIATERADAAGRRLQRLRRWTRLASGPTKRHLRHRAHKAALEWRAARANAEAACR